MSSICIRNRVAVWFRQRLAISSTRLRSISNQTTTATFGRPNVFAATLQLRDPERAPATTPWIASLLKTFFFSQCRRQVTSAVMYESCAKQALNPDFYDENGPYRLANTFANHLELTSLHVWICKLRIMCQMGPGAAADSDLAESRLLLQQLLERMWEHISRSLTGAGAHDIRLNKFLKEIQDSVFGSFIAYDQAFDCVGPILSGDRSNSTNQSCFADGQAAIESFSVATMSNLFGPTEAVRDTGNVEAARALAHYMVAQLDRLGRCSNHDLQSNEYEVRWDQPVSAASPSSPVIEMANKIRSVSSDQSSL